MASAEVFGRPDWRFPGSSVRRLRRLLVTNALPAVFFGFFCGVKTLFVMHALVGAARPAGGSSQAFAVLNLLDQVLGLVYFGLIALLCATRLPRLTGRRDVGTVATALFAAFAIMLIGVLPDRAVQPWAQAVGDVLLAIGMAYSLFALLYLRRSFSILPEARRLVTAGPYAVTRHPLYLGEGVAALGLLVTSAGPTAGVVALAALSAQLLRMRWEEAVLTREFPEYEAYARRVARFIPFIA